MVTAAMRLTATYPDRVTGAATGSPGDPLGAWVDRFGRTSSGTDAAGVPG